MTLNNIMTLKYGLEGHPRSLKMVPLESVGMISYLPSIVTMAVYLSISQTFSIKEWLDLEIWVWGRSRSFKMALFDKPCTTFYWSAIVTIPFSSYLTLNNIMTLKAGL